MRIRITSSIVLASLALGACTNDGGGGSRDAGANPDGAGTDTGGSSGTDASTGDGGSGGRGGSAAAGGTTTRGGSTGTGGHGGTMPADSGTRPDSGSSACSVSGMDILSDDAHELSGLSFAGDRLAFLSSDLSPSVAPTIDTVHTDGTGRTTLHTPTGQRRIHDLLVHGTKVYFLELNEDTVPMEELFSVPVTGGTATRLGTATFDGARFVGADDANLFLVWDTAQPVGAVFARVDETSGAKATAATLTNVSTPFYPQLSGDSIFFVDSTTGATTQVNAYGFPKAGANVTPTLLWTADTQHDTCYLGIGGLTATPTKLLCGLFGVESHARTGGSAMVVVPKDLTMRANEVVASDGENVYLNTPPASAAGVGSLQRVASTGGAITPIACDVRTLENRIADGLAPIQNEYEVIVGGDQLYWIEKSGTSATTWTVRHAAK